MSATGLDVFDRTLQTTHIWLNEVMAATGPDKQVAWHALGAVLRSIRNRVPLELAVHLGAELPLLVRGTYYDQWHVAESPERYRSLDEFLRSVTGNMGAIRPVDPRVAARAVFGVLTRHVPPGQIGKIRNALPEEVRDLWRLDLFASEAIPEEGVVTANPERASHLRT
jgi:uncharacterized protein (DUF2267 family)